ncbi:MAG: hypothetical protein GY861_20805 [bacterium]|nr:hypothetical protein [bacterium]
MVLEQVQLITCTNPHFRFVCSLEEVENDKYGIYSVTRTRSVKGRKTIEREAVFFLTDTDVSFLESVGAFLEPDTAPNEFSFTYAELEDLEALMLKPENLIPYPQTGFYLSLFRRAIGVVTARFGEDCACLRKGGRPDLAVLVV